MENGLFILQNNFPELWANRMIKAFLFLRDFKVLLRSGGLEDQDETYLDAIQYMQNLVPKEAPDGL